MKFLCRTLNTTKYDFANRDTNVHAHGNLYYNLRSVGLLDDILLDVWHIMACNHRYDLIKMLEIRYPNIIEIARSTGIAMEDIITNPKILIDSHIISKNKKYYLNILFVLRFEGGCFQTKQYDKFNIIYIIIL